MFILTTQGMLINLDFVRKITAIESGEGGEIVRLLLAEFDQNDYAELASVPQSERDKEQARRQIEEYKQKVLQCLRAQEPVCDLSKDK